MKTIDNKNYYTAKELAEKLQTTEVTIYRYKKDGLLNFTTIGRRDYYTDDNIAEFLNR